MKVFRIGDSHCINGWCGPLHTYKHCGSLLCYTFGKHPFAKCDLNRYQIFDNHVVVFCFGEIDCRCHIYKHVSESRTYQSIIDDIVKNYFTAIQAHVQKTIAKNLTICVYNVVPPVRKETVEQDPEYPCRGTDNERKSYVLYFNQKLKEYCEEYRYIFFDIYDNYCDEDGFIKKELSDGNVHIKDGTYIDKFIETTLRPIVSRE